MYGENLCDGCKYADLDSDKNPCNKCIQWVEGYLEATQYCNEKECNKNE